MRSPSSRPRAAGSSPSSWTRATDAGAKAKVKELVEAIGFEAVDAGPLSNARLVEPMLLWMASSRAVGSRDIAFKILRR